MTQVMYVPKILKSMQEICEEMGVGVKMVRHWISCGAPIAVDGDGTKKRYSAELMRLQVWREDKNKKDVVS